MYTLTVIRNRCDTKCMECEKLLDGLKNALKDDCLIIPTWAKEYNSDIIMRAIHECPNQALVLEGEDD